MKPLVSIITATYNLIENGRKEYIKQAIDSVCSQTYQNIEHIIVDGASTDGTVELIKDLQKGRENLYLYSEKDNGIYDAFNKGVKHAKGKYIIFLNSDDFYHSPFGIEKCVNLLEKDNLDFCISDCTVLFDTYIDKSYLSCYTAFRSFGIAHMNLICKKELLDKYPFDLKYKVCGDIDFWIKLFLNKYKYKELNYNFCSFRFGGVSSKSIDNSMELYEIFKTNYSNFYNLTDQELNYAVITKLFPDRLEDYFSSFFEDKDFYKFKYEETKTIYTATLPDNQFVKDFLLRKTDENMQKFDSLLNRFYTYFSSINYFLYKNLTKKDKKLFLDFFLKRWGEIDTCTTKEKNRLNTLFNNTYKLFQNRKNVYEPVTAEVNNKKIFLVSPTPIYDKTISKEEELSKYCEYVHSMLLEEYIMDDFFNIPEGSYIFDCGSSIGDATILLKSYYPNNPVISIEAQECYYNFLKKNIEINNYNDVITLNKFLSYYDDSVNNKITIDSIVRENKLDNVGLIKFDIEGYERFALDGAVDTITKFKPNLIIPIYHLQNDLMFIPYQLSKYKLPMKFKLKWIERRIWGMDCTLFVKFL